MASDAGLRPSLHKLAPIRDYSRPENEEQLLRLCYMLPWLKSMIPGLNSWSRPEGKALFIWIGRNVVVWPGTTVVMRYVHDYPFVADNVHADKELCFKRVNWVDRVLELSQHCLTVQSRGDPHVEVEYGINHFCTADVIQWQWLRQLLDLHVGKLGAKEFTVYERAVIKTAIKYYWQEYTPKRVKRKRRKAAGFEWNDECEAAFQTIRNSIVNQKIYGGNPKVQYHVATDASLTGLGGVVIQIPDQGRLPPRARPDQNGGLICWNCFEDGHTKPQCTKPQYTLEEKRKIKEAKDERMRVAGRVANTGPEISNHVAEYDMPQSPSARLTLVAGGIGCDEEDFLYDSGWEPHTSASCESIDITAEEFFHLEVCLQRWILKIIELSCSCHSSYPMSNSAGTSPNERPTR
ncbi:hypothetical protein LTR50_002733 [Elasticomyces elasticus]|nr:hypothetical protein LTR50_002733 [Elasticomyces elasticus]